jgi:hypothetical protein
VLIVQAISWLALLGAIIASVVLVRRKKIALPYLVLPGLVYLNLFLFLSERIISKSFTVFLFPSVFVNNWAIGIQFHVAITAAIAMFVLLANGKGLNE